MLTQEFYYLFKSVANLLVLATVIGSCSTKGRIYTYQDLIGNYKVKSQELDELESYFNSLVPEGKSVDIEFADDKTLGYFHIVESNDHNTHWNVKIESTLTDSLLQHLNWTRETLRSIKAKLDNANCISVRSGDPCNIGFRRRGNGEYFYNLFSEPIAENLRHNYNDSCTYIFLNEKVVLEYGGGTIGPQCFPDFRAPKY